MKTSHRACDFAGKTVHCDRCRRVFVFTLEDLLYCTPAGDHCCETCLTRGLELVVIDVGPPA